MRPTRELLVAAVLILGTLGGALALWLLGGDGPHGVGPGTVDGKLDSATTEAAGPTVVHSADLVGSATPGREVEPSIVMRHAVDDAGAVVPGPLLRVVDARTKERAAVADAEVFWVELEAVREWRVAGTHDASLALRFGERGRSREDGTFDLPIVEQRMFIVARVDGALGFRQLWRRRSGTERRELTIKLRTDVSIAARVFDAAGEPAAGIPVALFEQESSQRRMRLRLKSADDGRVSIPHLQLHRRRVADAPRTMELALHVPLADAVAVEFSSDAPPDEQVRLELPATGTVAIAAQGPEGFPLGCAGNVVLRIVGRTDGKSEPAKHRRRFRRVKPSGVDTVSFEHVGLDLEMLATIELDDDDFTWQTERFRGPTHAEQTTLVDAPMDARFGVLTGRVLVASTDATNSVAALREMTMLLSERRGRIEGETLRLDSAGRFELPFRLRNEPAQPIVLSVRGTSRPPREASRNLPGVTAGRRADLGDLVLGAADVLAFGRVVDDLSEPVADAIVVLQRQRDVGETSPRLRWVDEAFVHATTDADGRYELCGTSLPGPQQRVEVRARRRINMASPPFVAGAKVDLVMVRDGDFAGKLRTPPWLRARALELSVQRPGRRLFSTNPRLDLGVGSFRIGQLVPADDYVCVVTLVGFEQPLLRYEGVRIQPGRGGEADPRVANIDLTNAVYRYRVRALRPDGAGWRDPGAPLLVRKILASGAPSAAPVFAAFQWNRSWAEFYSPRPRVEIVAYGRGVAPIERVLTHGQHELRFAPAPVTEVELVGIDALPIGVTLRVEAIRTGKSALPKSIKTINVARRSRPGKFQLTNFVDRVNDRLQAGERVARLALQRPGTYRVRIRLIRKGVERTVARYVGRLVRGADDPNPPRVRFEVATNLLSGMLQDLEAPRAR